VALPTFFLSYTHRDDSTDTVTAFFEDLHKRLKSTVMGAPADAELGTFDRTIPNGQDWNTKLSSKLKDNRALVSVVTLSFFQNENCGKEVAVFARRHPNATLDNDGQIRDTTNILHIRWDEPGHYALNGVANAQVHPRFGTINWELPKTGTKAYRDAVKRYSERGLKRCVKPNRDYYEELLNAFAYRIRDMAELPEAGFPVTWNGIKSAFNSDWDDLPRFGGGVSPAPAAGIAPEPSGPADVVFFYLSAEPASVDERLVSFADRLLVHKSWQAPAGSPSTPLRLAFEAAQEAASMGQFSDFHCLSYPQIPESAEIVIGRLTELNRRSALVILIVDDELLAGEPLGRGALLKEILSSNRWRGAVVVVSTQGDLAASPMHPHLGPSERQSAVLLSGSKAAMFVTLQSVLIQERGRILRQSSSTTGHETLPRLSAVKTQ
jgi:hypothetical protein